MNRSTRRLILLELNELNFDVVEKYIASDAARFPALGRLCEGPRVRTSCETQYEELEPWIQWASVHTGKTYAEHGIFRLGDIVGSEIPQIFELVEQAGYKVGAISAMNAENRLKHPSYFIPDPWTQTPSDASWWSQSLTAAISQAVNDNAQSKITLLSALRVIFGLIRFGRVSHYRKYFKLITGSRKKPWMKALVLDLLLHDVHWSMFNFKKTNFSTLFLNAGAHIQHHYFYNAMPLRGEMPYKNPTWYVSDDEDPLADVLSLYNLIVGEYFERKDTDVILATGLTQKPYDKVKFYYRLNSHAEFLNSLNINFTDVFPRMTRDFSIEFKDELQAQKAQRVLASVYVEKDGIPLFGEIDNRGNNLFVTLTYPHEITSLMHYVVNERKALLMPKVSFVAIKNGMHQGDGFAFFTPGVSNYGLADGAHVSKIFKTILRYFGVA